MADEVRDPSVLETVAGGFRPGGYILATIHRAENRERTAMNAWAALLARLASADRPVVLALHPGTRAALDADDIRLSPDIRVIEPQGYRTTLGLQLHAAAVVTDSGGVQREAAWLHVPCLVLRGTTEWVEAVASSDGSMVVVGLDAVRAEQELARLAPPDRSRRDAERRAADVRVERAGAVEAIVETLAATPQPRRRGQEQLESVRRRRYRSVWCSCSLRPASSTVGPTGSRPRRSPVAIRSRSLRGGRQACPSGRWTRRATRSSGSGPTPERRCPAAMSLDGSSGSRTGKARATASRTTLVTMTKRPQPKPPMSRCLRSPK